MLGNLAPDTGTAGKVDLLDSGMLNHGIHNRRCIVPLAADDIHHAGGYPGIVEYFTKRPVAAGR